MGKYIGKNDIILIAVLAVIPVILLCLRITAARNTVSPVVAVYVKGELYGRYDPNESAIIQIGDSNTLQIADGKVFMLEADCPDQICVNSAPLDKSSPAKIVCLPNGVVVTMENAEDIQEIDGYVT